jgi:hypothetical protein
MILFSCFLIIFLKKKWQINYCLIVLKLFPLHVILIFSLSISGHPWILFYTAQSLTMLPIKTKLKNQIGATSRQVVATPEPNTINNGSLSELLSSESCNSDDPDECVLIDALATAISHVRISEPKRTRLCSPTGPIIVQQGSSNMKANNLCKAF